MKPKINISLDDISPHTRSSTQVLKRCFEILAINPDVKFTLFVPTAYWRTMGTTATQGPLRISKFPDFCDELRALPKQSFELAYHGHYHGLPLVSNNDEFAGVGLPEARGIIHDMMMEATKADLIDEFKGILRPPAWRMSPQAFQACLEAGISTFALSPDDYAMKTYQGYETNVRRVFYNCCPPFKPLNVFQMTEVVYHACEWDRSYLSEQFRDELLAFLGANDFEYVFIEGLADG